MVVYRVCCHRRKVDYSKFGEMEEVELGRIQKISGANLSRNWVVIPHVTLMEKWIPLKLKHSVSNRIKKQRRKNWT
ncbi:hypothetical protein ACLK1S_00780 [Escherichia coli]